MLGEHRHLQQTLREHGGVTAKAMIAKASCLGEETSSGFHGTTHGYWFSLHVAVSPPDADPFDAAFHAYVHRYLSSGETIPVIFDPSDHERICMDTESIERQDDANVQAVGELLQRRIEAFKAVGSATPQTVIRGSDDADTFTAAQPDPGDEIEQLEQLAKLHATGALTDAEFARAKAKLLGTSGSPRG